MPQKKAKRSKASTKEARRKRSTKAMKIAQKYKREHPNASMSTALKYGWKNV